MTGIKWYDMYLINVAVTEQKIKEFKEVQVILSIHRVSINFSILTKRVGADVVNTIYQKARVYLETSRSPTKIKTSDFQSFTNCIFVFIFYRLRRTYSMLDWLTLRDS